jgi:hypothetical protein
MDLEKENSRLREEVKQAKYDPKQKNYGSFV